VASTYRMQEQISSMMLGGATFERVEHEVIEPSDLSEDRKAALCHWALSYVRGSDQRGEMGTYMPILS
jgi:hypothetical protein